MRVLPVDDEINLLWDGDDTGHPIRTFEVDTSTTPHGIASIDRECDWVESNINAKGDLDMSGDGAVCDVTGDTQTGASNVDIDLAGGAVLAGTIDTDRDLIWTRRWSPAT